MVPEQRRPGCARLQRGGAAEQSQQPSGATATAGGVTCSVCGRVFRQSGDVKHHKCLQEHQKPVEEQQGAVQSAQCQRWFKESRVLEA